MGYEFAAHLRIARMLVVLEYDPNAIFLKKGLIDKSPGRLTVVQHIRIVMSANVDDLVILIIGFVWNIRGYKRRDRNFEKAHYSIVQCTIQIH